MSMNNAENALQNLTNKLNELAIAINSAYGDDNIAPALPYNFDNMIENISGLNTLENLKKVIKHGIDLTGGIVDIPPEEIDKCETIQELINRCGSAYHDYAVWDYFNIALDEYLEENHISLDTSFINTNGSIGDNIVAAYNAGQKKAITDAKTIVENGYSSEVELDPEKDYTLEELIHLAYENGLVAGSNQ